MSLPQIETSAFDLTARPQTAGRTSGLRSERDDGQFAETLDRATQASEPREANRRGADDEARESNDPALSTSDDQPTGGADTRDSTGDGQEAPRPEGESQRETHDADDGEATGDGEAAEPTAEFVLIATPEPVAVTPEIAAAETPPIEAAASHVVVTTEAPVTTTPPLGASPPEQGSNSTTAAAQPTPIADATGSEPLATTAAQGAQTEAKTTAESAQPLATEPSAAEGPPELQAASNATAESAEPTNDVQDQPAASQATAKEDAGQKEQRRRQAPATPPPTESEASAASQLQEATAATAKATAPPQSADAVDATQTLTATADAAAEPAADTAKPPPASASLSEVAAGRLPTSRAERGASDQPPAVDPTRFVARVGRAIQSAADRGGEVRLRLSPPELGTVQIKLSLGDGALTATLETDNANARNLLLDNLPALRERLAEQEIRIEKFDVDVRQEGQASQQQERDDTDDQPGSPAGGSGPPAERTAEAGGPAPSGPPPAIGDGELNLVA